MPGYGFYDEGSLYLTIKLNNAVAQDGAFTVIPPGYTHVIMMYLESNISFGTLDMSLVYGDDSVTITDELQDVTDFAGQAVRFTFGDMPPSLDAIFLLRFALKDDLLDQHLAYCPIHLDWEKQINAGYFVVPPLYEYAQLLYAETDGVISKVKLSRYSAGGGVSGTPYEITGTKQLISDLMGLSVLVEPVISGSYTKADVLLAFTKE
jgi:hypothetical protein